MAMKIWPKLKLNTFLTKPGKSEDERGKSNLRGKANVNEEYREAFRTKSYLEMWGNEQGQLGGAAITRFSSSSSSSSSSASSSCSSSLPNFHVKTLLEPQQEALLSRLSSLGPDPLLMDYFDASLEACNICESLLRSVHQTRASYGKIKRVLNLSQRLFEDGGCDQKRARAVILRELSGIALLRNPLSVISPLDFWEIRDSNTVLLRRLTAKHKKVRRRARLNRWCKNAGGIGLVVMYGAVMVALVVVVVHSVVGVVAAPGLVACGAGMARKRVKELGMLRTGVLERVCAQLDVAAKGVYILINDFDTMSRLVKRLYDEVEHRRTVAGMCVRMRNGKADQVLKEVVREFCARESCFLEQLDELEQHIHLCFLTINRSRRLVTDELLVGHREI